MIEANVAYGFSDLLLVPKYSTVVNRKDIELYVRLPKEHYFYSPLIPANMSDVVGEDLAVACLKQGSLVLLHRFDTIQNTMKLFKKLNNKFVGVSVGIQIADYESIKYFYDEGVRIICVDVAHGALENCLRMVRYIATTYPKVLLIAGNVCDSESALELFNVGADVVKVGIGNGLSCRTQSKTGVGIPQLSAIEECSIAAKEYTRGSGRKVSIISDGAIRTEGDLTKALCFSDMVMAGSIFAKCTEAPHNGVFRGSSTHKSDNWEGYHLDMSKSTWVDAVYKTYHEGLRSGMSYLGAHNLIELQREQRWIRVIK